MVVVVVVVVVADPLLLALPLLVLPLVGLIRLELLLDDGCDCQAVGARPRPRRLGRLCGTGKPLPAPLGHRTGDLNLCHTTPL